MSAIYVHIPFCNSACVYCNFHFTTSKKNRDTFTEALVREIELKKNFFSKDETISSLYFGGGTPSILNIIALEKIMEALHKNFEFENSFEFTFEANPENLNSENLTYYKSIGINRLSIGVQSFNEKDLLFMGRNHTAAQSIESILLAQDKGFGNLNIDLIYGIPGLNEAGWEKNLETFSDLGIPHLSAYQLTVEEKTPLHFQIKKKKKENINEDILLKHYSILKQRMSAEHFLHYEISNFSKTGFMSKHNLAYWQGGKYLGLGPSAHSYDENFRSWNIANTTLYIKNSKQGKFLYESEELSKKTKFNEYIFLSLRTMWGCKWNTISEVYGMDYLYHIKKQLNNFRKNNWFSFSKEGFSLNQEGFLFADAIASELFID
ncbi:MAG: radical SAM family heme chaperone HemW [Bacteroidales bacterium]|nr:radical SAM family heme chaperone HemW [Bacteroidales bacterium]